MIKMMVTVVIVFTICWLPFNILVLLLNEDNFIDWNILPFLWFAFHWLAMSHSCYNPIIYCYMNARFRGGFVQVLYRIPGVRRCWCIRRCARSRGGSMGAGIALTGEMMNNFAEGALLRKPRILIRNRRYFTPAAGQYLHNLHQHPSEANNKYKPEPVFMCGDNSFAVISAQDL